ncbi:MAG: hypothetical protein JXP73_07570 [Deltaproteobacteria bacterium]|nr:hypothetical protein [Deltaproteobacteria bacterium]
MMRSGLALLALAAVGCGIGRSEMHAPPSARPDAATGPVLPDGAPLPDAISTEGPPRLSDGPPFSDALPFQPDVLLLPDGRPYVTPDAARDLRRGDLPSEGPPPRPPDGLPPMRPDAPPDGPWPITPDARIEGPQPITPDARLDGPPPITPDVRPDEPPIITPDVPPEVPTPPPPDVRHDGRPPRPDSGPLPQECAAGAACTTDCTATCSGIGTMTCTCTDGVLVCGECQIPPITISPELCPDNPNRMECPTSGLACILFGSDGSIAGACLCAARGNSGALRWACILR